jgi:hypothetical protein
MSDIPMDAPEIIMGLDGVAVQYRFLLRKASTAPNMNTAASATIDA